MMERKNRPINIQSPGIKITQELIGFIQEKVSKLFTHFSEIISIDMLLKVSNTERKKTKICEIRLAIPGNDILASAQGKTFEEAVLCVVEIIKNQIKRKKSKIIGTRNDISIKHLPS